MDLKRTLFFSPPDIVFVARMSQKSYCMKSWLREFWDSNGYMVSSFVFWTSFPETILRDFLTITSHFVWLKTSCFFFERQKQTRLELTSNQPRVWYPPEDVIPAIFEVWLFNLGAYVSQASGYIFAFVIWEAMARCISWTSVGRTQRRVDWICIGCVYFLLAG